MNVNYHKECEKILNIISDEDIPKKLLLHSCCAPCSTYVLSHLSSFFDITLLYYNPNIQPFSEFEKRKNEQIELLGKLTSKNRLDFLDCDYEEEKFVEISSGLENEREGGGRCFLCYLLRLEKTAKMAKDLGFDYFCTTLSVSPYKNANKLNEIGLMLEKKYGVKYLLSDFKKNNGYKKSIEMSKEYGLYRQDYCGCSFSKIKKLEN